MKLIDLKETSKTPKLPRRDSKFGVGKKMGYDLYFHRMYEDEIVPPDALQTAQKAAEGFNYNIVKYNLKNGNLTLIQSPDFDTNPEPIVGNQVLVKPDGSVKAMRPSADPWIYHHKWLFVRDDYPGFDVDSSKQRSIQWMSLPDIDYRRIGKKSFWENNVLNRLGL